MSKKHPEPRRSGGSGHWQGFFQGSQRIVRSQPRCKASWGLDVKDSWTDRPAHPGAVIAARPRTRDMMRDASNAGLVAAQLLFARLPGSGRATAHLYPQNATQAADEAWGQTVQGHPSPSVAGPAITDAERADPTPQQDENSPHEEDV